jgi:DNA-binding transcriptional regulator/RsmH inhibitor MraZ
VVGSRQYLEIWDPERLEERFAVLHREGVSSVAKRLAGRV